MKGDHVTRTPFLCSGLLAYRHVTSIGIEVKYLMRVPDLSELEQSRTKLLKSVLRSRAK
jgi:hypothetical protein